MTFELAFQIACIVMLIVAQMCAYIYPYTDKRWLNFSIGSCLSIGLYYLFFRVTHQVPNTWLMVASTLYGVLIGRETKEEQTAQSKYQFILKGVHNKKLIFTDPFDNFLVYGGANSGKTKSIGKPLLEQYIKHHFAGIIYDLKDFDYTKTACYLMQKHQYPYDFYPICFTDINYSYRTNPVKPGIIDEYILEQLADDILSASIGKDSKRDEWFYGALGIFKGVFFRFFKDHPNLCTLPHILNFIVHNDKERISIFLEQRHESKALARGFLDAADAPKTQASILSSLTNYIGSMAFNKKICYVLAGDDFDFNMIDPQQPKLIAISSSYALEKILAPIVSLMISISSRKFSLANQIPAMYFLDEATTFRINEFEKMPSILREYKCSFTLLTQSASKIENIYGKFDRSSIESNFSNVFLGRTKDKEALKDYGMFFSKKEVIKRTDTSGSSSHSNSRSTSLTRTKEQRYDPDFFTQLKSGEFVGTTAHANIREFHMNFKLFDEPIDMALPAVNQVNHTTLEKGYNDIVGIVKGIA